MTQASDIPQRRTLARIGTFVAERRGLVRDYLSAISGAGGRLVFSLAYFIALANTLSIAEFGMFATASAAGVMLSRILAFGFISALYRTATIRPNLIGTFTAGFLLLARIVAAGAGRCLVRRLPDLLCQHRAAVCLCGDRVCRSAFVAAGRGGADRQQRPRQIRPRRRAGYPGDGAAGARRRAVHVLRRNTASGYGRGFTSAPMPPRCCSPSASSTRANDCGCGSNSISGGSPIPSTWPAPKCCSTCSRNSTSCSCWRSADRISPASMPSSCGWST